MSPAKLNHAPIRLIAVHGDDHPTACARDSIVSTLGVELAEDAFEAVKVLQGAPFADVAAIEHRVHSNPFYTLLRRALQERPGTDPQTNLRFHGEAKIAPNHTLKRAVVAWYDAWVAQRATASSAITTVDADDYGVAALC